jgi:uncharacterized protein YrzB (UPF0473 family)
MVRITLQFNGLSVKVKLYETIEWILHFIAIILFAGVEFLFTGLLKERYIIMSEHEHDCDCGCGHDHEHDHDHMNVTLTLDDGTDLECEVLCIFPVGEKDYIALVPAEREDDEDGEIFLYQFIEHENDEIELLNIENDDEFEAVSDAFDELMDSEEFDDMFDDEDEDEIEDEEK